MFFPPTVNKIEVAIVPGICLSYRRLTSDPKVQVEALRPQSLLLSQEMVIETKKDASPGSLDHESAFENCH